MNNIKGRSAKPSIAYLMSRFPRITETFILREMLELERLGQPVIILPLLRVQQAVRHHETEQLRDRVHYTPFISFPILWANLVYLWRMPLRYLKLLFSVLKGNFGSANLFFGALGIFPKSVYFAKLITELGVAHVHAHFATHPALSALIISTLSGVGFSVTVHAHDIFVHKAMLGEKLRKARFIAAISEFNRRYLLDLFPGLDERKIHIVRCGIKPEAYDFGKDRRAEDSADGKFNILSVASLQPYKGIEFLIRACASVKKRLPNLRCTVIGEGEDRKKLEALIAELDLAETIRLVGARPQNEVAEYLRKADLFVLPSVVAADGQMEGIPVALMEAMASGLAVVSTRLSGIPELIVDGENGLLVAPKDAEALAEAVLRLSENPALRSRMGAAGRRTVEREYDLRQNVKKLKTLFDEYSKADSAAFNLSRTAENSLDPQILEEVKNNLRGVFPEASAQNFEVQPAAIKQGHDSEVYALTISSNGGAARDVVLKLHRPARQNVESQILGGKAHAANEFRALSSLWSEFGAGGGQFRVPEPLAYIPEQAAVITEKCEGERLDQLIYLQAVGRGKASPARLAEAFESCGEWLARFHAATRRNADKSEVINRLRREFKGDLQTCKNFRFDAPLLDRAAKSFQKLIDSIENGDGFIVSQHCDFGPHNVFVRDETVTVIDFEGMQDGLIYDDLAYFLSLVEVMPFYHLSPSLKQNIRAAFLRGYAVKGSFDARVLELYQIPVMIKIAAHNPAFTAQGGKLRFLRRHLRQRAYTNWLEARV